ncbi:29209_t:CDS:2, partial [Gigaspora margarita]
NNIWDKAPDNTNVAEACHSNANRDGKFLSLENAILIAKRYDTRNFITCNTQKKYGIRKTGKNLGVIAREKQAIRRSAKKRANSISKAESSTKSKRTKRIKKIENSQDLTDALAEFDLEKEEKLKQELGLKE